MASIVDVVNGTRFIITRYCLHRLDFTFDALHMACAKLLRQGKFYNIDSAADRADLALIGLS